MSFQNFWDNYVVPPIAASGAIVPPFYGFQVKTAQQRGESIPRFVFKKAVLDGLKSAPVTGVLVGSQIVAQNAFEKMFSILTDGGKEEKNPMTMFASSLLAASATVHFNVAFTAQTAGEDPIQAMKRLTMKTTGAVTLRESIFLSSLAINEYVEEKIKKNLKDHPLLGYGTAFTIGALGAVISHPADTLFTRWCAGMEISSAKTLGSGVFARAGAVGLFAICYKIFKDSLKFK